jgi:hypothetical protein
MIERCVQNFIVCRRQGDLRQRNLTDQNRETRQRMRIEMEKELLLFRNRNWIGQTQSKKAELCSIMLRRNKDNFDENLDD